MDSEKPVIILFSEWYYPGYKAGGPIQSCINLVKTMASHFDFYVVCSDRDLDSPAAYEGIPANQWVTGKSGEQVFYASPGVINKNWLKQLFRQFPDSTVYLNSMFSFAFTLLPFEVSRSFRKLKLVLAPRGMLHPGALRLKASKKKLFLLMFKMLGWHKKIRFQATTEEEAGYIQRKFPGAKITVTGNIPSFRTTKPATLHKKTGSLKLLFLGRIHPTKNLDFVLGLLNKPWQGSIEIELIGEPGPPAYIQQCQSLIQQLPSNISVIQSGALPQELGFEKILDTHALILPSLGENFGHAIFESLISGKPVLISDKTPWRNLEQNHAGWDISLDNRADFTAALQTLLEMDQQSYDRWSTGAYQLAYNYFRNASYIDSYLSLFK